jgi:hypothetical protein
MEHSNYTHWRGDILNVNNNDDDEEKCLTQPDRPDFNPNHWERQNFSLQGNGIWQPYFQPTPIPFDEPCYQQLPVFELSRKQLLPGMHYCSDMAVKGWTFPNLKDTLRPEYQQTTTNDWLWGHRQRASQIVQKYFALQPWLQQKMDAAVAVLDDPSTKQQEKQKSCLAVHIRLTDKGSGREKQGIDAYLPYIEAFVRATLENNNNNNSNDNKDDNEPVIFLATDDARTLDQLLDASPSLLKRSMFQTQPNVLLSSSEQATFSAFHTQRHRLNTETLVDIYSLSKCQFLVHGYSAVAEAAVYLNPTLHHHHRSVNIDVPPDERMDVAAFQDRVLVTVRENII